MSLFRLDASIKVDGSASREIADVVEQHWLATHPGDRVVRRHIGTEPLPSDAWAHAVSASWTPAEERTPEQQAAAELVTGLADELLEADAILLAVPLYNFGVSQHIKAWFDLVITDPRGKDAPLLAGKPVVLATVRGGAYGAGTPREGWDHSTAYLRRILGRRLGRRPDRRRARVHPGRREPGPRRVHRPRQGAAPGGAGHRQEAGRALAAGVSLAQAS